MDGRIVVTGGSGRWSCVVADLRSEGFDVTDVDLVKSQHPGDRMLAVDLNDRGQAIEAIGGARAVVHSAAPPAPNIVTPLEVFRVNTMSTHNVCSAAPMAEVDRVVWASSETLIRIPFQRERPWCSPIDEDHPRLPEFHHALSKLVGEEVAEQFSPWSGAPMERSGSRTSWSQTATNDSDLLGRPLPAGVEPAGTLPRCSACWPKCTGRPGVSGGCGNGDAAVGSTRRVPSSGTSLRTSGATTANPVGGGATRLRCR